MARVIKEVSLEVSKPNVFQALVAKQCDSNSRYLNVTLMNEGRKISIKPSSTVTLNACRPGNECNSFLGEVNENGTAELPIHAWILENAGLVTCDVSVMSSEDHKLTSTTFYINVEEAANVEGVISDEEWIERATAETERVKAEEARVAAEAARVTAEELRKSAEVTRESGEIARNTAEVERANAENERIAKEVTREDSEVERVSNETARVEVETTRVASEEIRVASESDRVATEIRRNTAEDARIAAENQRISAENERKAAEEERKKVLPPMSSFANAIRGKASGEIVAVDDVSPIEHLLDVKVASKNHLPYPYADTTKTVYGITFTDNGDGTITANGTATANATFNVCKDGNWSDCYLPAGKYYFSGTPSGATTSNYRIVFALRNASGAMVINQIVSSKGYAFSIAEPAIKMYCQITVFNGITVENLIFEPMLELGDTATEHTPFVASVEGVTVKCADKLYGETAQTATADANGNVVGLHSLSPGMTLYAEPMGQGVINSNDVIEKLYFDTTANIDDYLASLTYATSGSYMGTNQLVSGSASGIYLVALDLSTQTSGAVSGYSLVVLTMSGSSVLSMTMLYSTTVFDLSSQLSGFKADKVGWQTSNIDFATTVSSVSTQFEPINGTVVTDSLKRVVITVEYSRDTQKAIEKMIADAIASLT